ncbi:trimeric intracellular cation channel family protein, partial [Klebsiella oxytoca]
PKAVVIIITLVAGLTARLLAIRYKLGLPVFNYANQD